jgi:thiol-disulfide isomerase/thioredoxin
MTLAHRLLAALVIGGSFPVPAFAKEPPTPQVGDAAPDLLGRDVEGKEVRLSGFRDKVVVVSFFASWCEPCREELPILESLQRAGASKGLQVIAVDSKEDPQVYRSLVKRNPAYQLRFVSDARGGVSNAYGVKAIPHMFLIGKDGKISFVNVGYGKSVINKLIPEVNAVLNVNVAAPAVTTDTESAR